MERQRRSSSKVEDMNSIRAMTRRYRQTRGDTAAASSKPINKRELKGATTAVPLRQVSREREKRRRARPCPRPQLSPTPLLPFAQGEVEEDFESMTVQAEHINPTMETSFMEIEVRNPSTGFSPAPALLPPLSCPRASSPDTRSLYALPPGARPRPAATGGRRAAKAAARWGERQATAAGRL